MWFMDQIVAWLNSVSQYFLDAYDEVRGWVFPFYYLAMPLYWLYASFFYISYYFSQFNEWLDWAAGQLSQLLSWGTVWSYILSYVPNLISLRDWFYDWWGSIRAKITDWWSAESVTVRGWIDTAVQPFNSLKSDWDSFWQYTWPGWESIVDSLKSDWDNFWSFTFPNLVSRGWLTAWWNDRLKDVQSLLDSAFTARASWWEGWQDIRTSVLTFFSDPVEYLWQRFTDWFMGREG